jgi:RecA/RadA recombinase
MGAKTKKFNFRQAAKKCGNEHVGKAKTAEEYISTGSYALNALIGGDLLKGIPDDTVIMYAGQEAVGKTYLLMRQAYKLKQQGYFIYYFDSEGASRDEMFEEYKFSKDDYEIMPVDRVEECRRQIFSLADQYVEHVNGLDPEEYKDRPKMAFMLDSIGNLSSNKSIKDTAENKDTKDMSKQQQLRRLFMDLTVKLHSAHIPFLVSNHVYEEIGAWVPTKTVSGGGGAKYNSSNIIMLKKKDIKDEKTKQFTASELTATNVKSRYCRPRLQVKIYLDYEYGLHPFYGLDELAVQAGLLRKIKVGAANHYEIMDPKIPKEDWMTVPCPKGGMEIHKRSTIGTVLNELNEWVKDNFLLKTVVADDEEDDYFQNMENIIIEEDEPVEKPKAKGKAPKAGKKTTTKKPVDDGGGGEE